MPTLIPEEPGFSTTSERKVWELLRSQLGDVPEPEDVTAWLRDHLPAPVVVADIATGRGVRDVPENRPG